MRFTFFACVGVISSLLLATMTMAQTDYPNNYPNNSIPYTGWSFSGHVDHVNIDKEAAADPKALVEDTATAFGFAGEYYSSESSNTLSLGMSFLIYDDNAAFSQDVEYYDGDVERASSDANAFLLYAEFGPRYKFGANNASFFTVRGGVTGIFGSQRGIGYCSDCYSEDIDIDGGVYGLLGIGQTLGGLELSLQFQQYLSGDLDNSIRLKLGGAF